MLGYMSLMDLKRTIVSVQEGGFEEWEVDEDKNERAFSVLIQCLDKRSLGLVMRDGKNSGRKSLSILRKHYAGDGKPRVMVLYTQLSSLEKNTNETVTDYILRAEVISTSLKSAGEPGVTDAMLISMVLKGLPSEYKQFSVVVMQSDKVYTFQEFKVALRNFEENEKVCHQKNNSNIMYTHDKRNGGKSKAHGGKTLTCYNCDTEGHKWQDCSEPMKKYCKVCKSDTHSIANCRKNRGGNNNNNRRNSNNQARSVTSGTFNFMIDVSPGGQVDEVPPAPRFPVGRIAVFLVDSGCTSHIVNDETCFVEFDDSFRPQTHSVTLADGSRNSGLAEKIGVVVTCFVDTDNVRHTITLSGVLYIPTYPQNMFSVNKAIENGSSVLFFPGYAQLVTPNGTTFSIRMERGLFWLDTGHQMIDSANLVRDLSDWHSTFGHCNHGDILRLQNLVDGLTIGSKEKVECTTCILGKQTNEISREPSKRASVPLELVSSDVNGPVMPVSSDGFQYSISFVDNYSGFLFVYFMKRKSDAVSALSKFIADVAPFGKVRELLNLTPESELVKLRSDGGGEYMGKEFKSVLVTNKIRHEQSAPYSPHQNGVAERAWRTLFEMARCMLFEGKLPKPMWPYAVMAAAYVRNRCYQQRLKQTAYFALTGNKPDVSNMHPFGSTCFVYEVNHKSKLDARSKQGIFVGYDRETPAYLVYFPDEEKVLKRRVVKFVKNSTVGSAPGWADDSDHVPGSELIPREDRDARVRIRDAPDVRLIPPRIAVTNEHNVDIPARIPVTPPEELTPPPMLSPIVEGDESNCTPFVPRNRAVPLGTPGGGFGSPADVDTPQVEGERRYPLRENRNVRPRNLEDYACFNMDVCCLAASRQVPKTYRQAIESPDSELWKEAMDDEMRSLEENDTFEVVALPSDTKAVGGRWVYAIKDGGGSPIYKARYVAKGFSQVEGIDYFETFAPTPKMTSVRSIMQIAAENDLTVHQMDVKTAYLNAPIDCLIFVAQPEGYREESTALVWKLKKSLYGLKQSGKNWNEHIDSFFAENRFVRFDADPCVYSRDDSSGFVVLILWVDDIVLSGTSLTYIDKMKTLLKNRYRMKDLGPISGFLGIQFSQTEGGITMEQSVYLQNVLEKFEMQNCKPRGTPCEMNPSASNPSQAYEHQSPRKYREIIGSLIYAMACTRPDLCWIVTKLSQHLDNPTEADWVMVKHVLRYLKGTLDLKLHYKKSSSGLCLSGWSDSDWGSSVEDRRSTTGYLFYLNPEGPPISWNSKKQATVALSSCEAEYMALAASVQECLFLHMLLKDFLDGQESVEIKADNQGAMGLASKRVTEKRSKHIDIRFHFIREKVENGFISLTHVASEENIADIMTKPVPKPKLLKFREMLFG